MVNSIVHTAVARKMLCSPANSLIADTEFACAVGIMLRILKAGEEKKLEAEQTLNVCALKQWLFSTYAKELSGEFDIPCQNLIAMLKDYHAKEESFTAQLKELFCLGYEQELVFPKGRFL